MRYDRTIIGYHGCDRKVARHLLKGEPFKESQNKYDWLGAGVYFWEFGPDRAFRFAKEQKRRDRVQQPDVVGAIIQLGNCLDLLDTKFTSLLGEAYPIRLEIMCKTGKPLPQNRGISPDQKLRNLDCSFLNWYLSEAVEEKIPFDTVRACFWEGGPIFPNSSIQKESHIQVAVRNLNCILGVFKPALKYE